MGRSAIRHIEIQKGKYMDFDLQQYKELPISKWPRVLQMDFIITMQIFHNIHLIPLSTLEQIMELGEIVEEDIQDLLEFVE